MNALGHCRALSVVKEPFKDGQRLVIPQRHDEVRGKIVGIDVEHQVRKNPEIQRFVELLVARFVEALSFVHRFRRAQRCKLLRIVAVGDRLVLRVVNLTHKPRVRDGDVVSLQIVVDVDFPVAIENVVAALREFRSLEMEAAGLLGYFPEPIF